VRELALDLAEGCGRAPGLVAAAGRRDGRDAPAGILTATGLAASAFAPTAHGGRPAVRNPGHWQSRAGRRNVRRPRTGQGRAILPGAPA
jgi:hypothetical protein